MAGALGVDDRGALDLQLSMHEADFSPLLGAEGPMLSDARSDTSYEDDEFRKDAVSRVDSRSQSTSPKSARSELNTKQNDSPATSSLSERRAIALTEEMKSSWRATFDAAIYSSSQQTQTRLSTLTIPALISPQSLASSAMDDSRAYLIPEPSPSYRRPALRPRRLSLSPALPSIPELQLSVSEAHDTSDAESSLGIYEHSVDDFLYDNLSEAGFSTTSLPYQSAYGENEGEEEEVEEDDEYGQDTFSVGTCPCTYFGYLDVKTAF